jgi:nucleotide-binding universal stress UspA family protein
MSYKCILLPVTGENPGEGAVAYAARLAASFDGFLRVLFPKGESIEVARFRYPSLGDSFFVQVEQASRSAAEAREQEARRRVEGVIGAVLSEGAAESGFQWEPVDADAPTALRLQGGLYDLLVMDDAGRSDSDLVDAALFQAARPVLFVPDDAAERAPGAAMERVMIGWNRSAEAGRAVVAALPLLQKAEAVTICAVRTAAKQGPSPRQLAEYLARHDISADIIRPEPRGGAIGDVLLSEAAGGDLLVAGANYAGRQRSIAAGGVTAQLLDKAALPVLLAH